MQRRWFLTLGALSAIAVAGGGAIALVQPGFDEGRLSPVARHVVRAAAAAVLDGSLPSQSDARQASLNRLLDGVEALATALPPHAQAELSELLTVLSTAPGRIALAGLRPDWPSATVQEVQLAFEGMRFSSLSLRQQAYHALHDIVAAAYFSDASTWPLLGYPGPIKI